MEARTKTNRTNEEIIESISCRVALKDAPLYAFWNLITKKATDDEECVIRSYVDKTGMFIEYHQSMMEMDECYLYDFFMLELYRLMMCHHSTRIINPDPELLYIASNLTLLESLELELPMVKMEFPGKESYGFTFKCNTLEEWYSHLKKVKKESIKMKFKQCSKGTMDKDIDGKDVSVEEAGEGEGKIFLPDYGKFNAKNWKNEEKEGQGDAREALELMIKNVIDQNVPLDNKESLKDCSTMGSPCRKILLGEKKHKFNNCRVLLKRFIQNVEDEETKETRSKPHRRYDLDNPGQMKKQRSQLIIGIDTSGSIGMDDVNTFKDVIASMTKIADVDSVCWDTEVMENTFTNFKDLKKSADRLKTEGGGGTDPDCFLEWAVEKKYRGAIILTDGYFDEPNVPKGLKTVWVLTTGGSASELKGHDVYTLEELT